MDEKKKQLLIKVGIPIIILVLGLGGYFYYSSQQLVDDSTKNNNPNIVNNTGSNNKIGSGDNKIDNLTGEELGQNNNSSGANNSESTKLYSNFVNNFIPESFSDFSIKEGKWEGLKEDVIIFSKFKVTQSIPVLGNLNFKFTNYYNVDNGEINLASKGNILAKGNIKYLDLKNPDKEKNLNNIDFFTNIMTIFKDSKYFIGFKELNLKSNNAELTQLFDNFQKKSSLLNKWYMLDKESVMTNKQINNASDIFSFYKKISNIKKDLNQNKLFTLKNKKSIEGGEEWELVPNLEELNKMFPQLKSKNSSNDNIFTGKLVKKGENLEIIGNLKNSNNGNDPQYIKFNIGTKDGEIQIISKGEDKKSLKVIYKIENNLITMDVEGEGENQKIKGKITLNILNKNGKKSYSLLLMFNGLDPETSKKINEFNLKIQNTIEKSQKINIEEPKDYLNGTDFLKKNGLGINTTTTTTNIENPTTGENLNNNNSNPLGIEDNNNQNNSGNNQNNSGNNQNNNGDNSNVVNSGNNISSRNEINGSENDKLETNNSGNNNINVEIKSGNDKINIDTNSNSGNDKIELEVNNNSGNNKIELETNNSGNNVEVNNSGNNKIELETNNSEEKSNINNGGNQDQPKIDLDKLSEPKLDL